LDAQYFACFIECAISGTVDTAGLQRSDINRILNGNPALQRMIGASQRRSQKDILSWQPEIDRVRKIVLKLARGHVVYELYPKLDEPLEVTFAPIAVLSKEEQAAFECSISGRLNLWPEIGSRAFLHTCGKSPDRFEQSGIGPWYKRAGIVTRWSRLVVSW
jgi:hypothetical protein